MPRPPPMRWDDDAPSPLLLSAPLSVRIAGSLEQLLEVEHVCRRHRCYASVLAKVSPHLGLYFAIRAGRKTLIGHHLL